MCWRLPTARETDTVRQLLGVLQRMTATEEAVMDFLTGNEYQSLTLSKKMKEDVERRRKKNNDAISLNYLIKKGLSIKQPLKIILKGR